MKHLEDSIKQCARELGFAACGLARAERVDAATEQHVRQWLADGKNAGMGYMANHLDMRLDPRLLMPEVKTIVSLALNYAPAQMLPKGEPQMAAYALGLDYHDVMRRMMLQLVEHIYPGEVIYHGHKALPSARYRVFVDSGPVLERYWAVKAGLGWIGKNRQLIIPHAGSMFFLGELFIDQALEPDSPMDARCGNCHRCLDACPTQAIAENREFDAERCLSYQLIENRGALSNEAVEAMGDCFYGCDRCQQACPWNRFAVPTRIPELQPKQELLGMTREKWQSLTVEQYQALFKGSAVKRAKYDGLMRNIHGLKSSQT